MEDFFGTPVLRESFLFNYGDLQPVKLFQGELEGYTSDKLKKFILKAINVSSFKSVSPLAEKLLNENVIIPVVLNKGFFRAALSKVYYFILDELMIKTDAEKRFVFAYYMSTDNKVYLILTNEANIFSWIKDENMAYTVFHELMHYAAANELNDFYKVWGNFFVDFYGKFFENQYKLFTGKTLTPQNKVDIKNVIIKYYLKTLKEVDKKLITPKEINTVYTSVLKMYSTKHKTALYRFLSDNNSSMEDKLELCFDVLYTIVYNAFTNSNKLYSLIQYPQVRDTIQTMANTYDKMNVGSQYSDRSFTFQELYIPSEIAAVAIGNKNCRQLLKSTLQLLD
jgi:hypothetical protein